MGVVRLDHQSREVRVSGEFAISHETVYDFFKTISANDYDRTLEKALVLGCYTLQLNDIGQMLDNAARDINGDLMRLKMLFELRGIRERTTAKGEILERDIADVLQDFADAHKWGDAITATGSKIGTVPRRKVGDFVIAVNDDKGYGSIVIEAKFDKSVVLGDLTSIDKASTSETSAQAQNLLGLANRQSDFAIFVADKNNAHKSVVDAGPLSFYPEQPGFVAVIDRAQGDWQALHIAYAISRSLITAGRCSAEDWDAIELIVKRAGAAVARLGAAELALDSIGKSASDILKQLTRLDEIRESSKHDVEAITRAVQTWRNAPPNALERKLFFTRSDE